MADRKYVAWKYAQAVNEGSSVRLRCNFCGKETTGGKVGTATTAKMNEFLGELQRKEKQKADDRYFAALGWRPSKNPGVSTQPDVEEASKNIIDGDIKKFA